MVAVELPAVAPGAGGAPLWQLATLGAVYGAGTGGVLALVRARRRGGARNLDRLARAAGWAFALPGWAALAVAAAAVGLLLAMWAGVYDIGYHVDHGRDAGPLGNPGHLPLLLGLFLTFAGGVLALGLADPADATPAWLPAGRGRRVPLGGVLLTGCMALAMAALVLDDVWHRIFGQDVTLWSPTHFIYLFGGVLTVIGMLVLLVEGAAARRARAAPASRRIELGGRAGPVLRVELARASGLLARAGRAWRAVQRAALMGGLLGGLELFLAEFDYGVPLYRQVWQPLLLAVFAGFVFTAARAWIGRGAALGAAAVYMAVRATGIVVPLLAGVSPSSMPLLVAEALAVEALALAVDPRSRALRFGAGAGLLAGTAGFAAEYGWSQIAMPLPWTAGLLPEGVILAALGGLAAGVLGALFAGALRGTLPPPRTARIACVGAFALLALLGADAAVKHVPDARATVRLRDVTAPPERTAIATVRLTPPAAARRANWLYVLAWAGDAPRVVDRLRRVGDGVYRSRRPIPLGGRWKVGLRLNSGYARGSVPIRLPVDRGLPGARQRLPAVVTGAQLSRALRRSAGAELPAPARFTRPFGDDGLIVLRETRGNVAGWLWGAAIALTALTWALAIAALALALGRLGRRGRRLAAARLDPRAADGPLRRPGASSPPTRRAGARAPRAPAATSSSDP